MFDTEKLIEYLKTRKIQFLDETKITSVEVETKTYNPFDVTFVCKLYFDNHMLIVIDKNDNGYRVRVGENSGWVGGLHYLSNLEVFNIPKLDTDFLIEGFKSNVQLYSLYTKYASGSLNEVLFKGTLKECVDFTISKGYEQRASQEFMTANGLHKTVWYEKYKGTFREFYYVINNYNENAKLYAL